MKPYIPERLIIEKSVIDSQITSNVLAKIPDLPVDYIDSIDEVLQETKYRNPTFSRAKKSLILAAGKGKLFKACPGQQSRGTSKNICCDYFVINFASNCHMECSYCYLQSYLNFPYLIVFANIEKIFEELRTTLDQHPEKNFRIGTGELADSLALDPLTGYSRPLVKFFAERNNAILELKTKSDFIENLLGLDHRGKTVVAWSLNPKFIQECEEHKTASIDQRLAAAQACIREGYQVAFHFDPMIHYSGWQEGYQEVISEIYSRIPSSSICWISLGGLRMTPSLLDVIRKRFPKSILPHGELIPAEDGKLRYFKPIRVEMYRKLSQWIQEFDQSTPVYACMERPEVWDKAFGGQPKSDEDLGKSLVNLGLQ